MGSLLGSFGQGVDGLFGYITWVLLVPMANEPRREKTGFLHVRKQRRETDQRLCFRLTDGTIPLLSKSEISSL